MLPRSSQEFVMAPNRKNDASSSPLVCFAYHTTTLTLLSWEPEPLSQLSAICNHLTATFLQLLFYKSRKKGRFFSIQTILWPANYSRPENLVLTSTFCSFYFLNAIKIVHLDQEQLCHLKIRPYGINGQLFKLQFTHSHQCP